MRVGRTRASLALVSLLVVGAWVGSAFAHGASTKLARDAGPGLSLPSVTATVPLVGPVATPSVSVAVPPVTVAVPAVTATVPAVTVSVPVAGVAVTTPAVTVATPPVGVTTPTVAVVKPVASVVEAVATASTTASVVPTTTTGVSPKQSGIAGSTRVESAAAAHRRSARARRLRLARQRRHAARTRRSTPVPATTRAASTPPVPATGSISGDAPSLALTTPTPAATPFDPPFLPIVAAVKSAPSMLLGSGPGALSYRMDAVPFSSPLLTGGFNGASRLVASLVPQLSMASVVKRVAPMAATSQPPLAAPVGGGRSPGALDAADRGIGIDTPIGRVGISGDGYQFGRWRYPLASVGGIATTVLISLAALAAITALLGGVSAGAALVRRRRAASSSEPVADPALEPATTYEGWNL